MRTRGPIPVQSKGFALYTLSYGDDQRSLLNNISSNFALKLGDRHITAAAGKFNCGKFRARRGYGLVG